MCARFSGAQAEWSTGIAGGLHGLLDLLWGRNANPGDRPTVVRGADLDGLTPYRSSTGEQEWANLHACRRRRLHEAPSAGRQVASLGLSVPSQNAALLA